MIEVLDNVLQLAILALCLALSFMHFSSSRSDERLMTLGFFGCSFLGLAYWTAYLLVFGTTPSYFYVSELAWVASYVFLLMLVAALDERRSPCPPVPAAWFAVGVMVPLFALYVMHGDVLLNLADCSIMAAIGFFAIRGLATPPIDGPEGDLRLHVAVLSWWVLQLAVWTASCFWGADSLTPYIVSDVALSLAYLALNLEMRRALP